MVLMAASPLVSGLTTCPGFPGFCSESFPGQLCNVVCDFGRNNVPLCQDDGTWTDIPRCVEHDPGVEEQVPGLCPSIPGYCAATFLNKNCRFDCVSGPDIDSLCTSDGTWSPYPTCEGDLRETKDGCDGCPGPQGGSRNRTAEAIIGSNTISDRRVPKVISSDGARKNIPSFAGNIKIGPSGNKIEQSFRQQLRPVPQQQQRPAPQQQQRQATQQQQRQAPQQQQRPIQQQQQRIFPQQQQQFAAQTPQPQQQQQQQFPFAPQQQQQQQFAAQRPQQQQQQRFPFAPQQQQQQQLQIAPQQRQQQQGGVSLFDQIKNRINQGNRQQQQQSQRARQPPPQEAIQQQQQTIQAQPQQSFQPQPRRQPQQQNGGRFGVFEAVSLSGDGGPSPPEISGQRQQPQVQNEFFGEFQSVNL